MSIYFKCCVGNGYNGYINLIVPTRLKIKKNKNNVNTQDQIINAIYFPYSINTFNYFASSI